MSKNGPKARKHVCSICEVSRWVEQFGGRSASILDSSSVCDLCTLEGKARERIAALENIIAALETRVSTLESRPCCRCLPHHSGTASTVVRTDAAETETPREIKSSSGKTKETIAPNTDGSTTEKKRRNRRKKRKTPKKDNVETEEETSEGWTLVRSKRTKRDKSNSEKTHATKVTKEKCASNKSVNSGRVIMFGDSQTKGLQGLVASRLRRNVRVSSLPGRGNSAIRCEVERTPITESSVVAIAVSGNDLYLRNYRIGDTKKIITDTMGAVDDAGLKTRKRLVIGMLPRRVPSRKAYSKNLAINQRLSDLCVAERVLFVDPYPHLYGRNDFYHRDGVHLSMRGKAEFANFIANAVRRSDRISHRAGDRNISLSEAPVRSFSDAVKKGIPKTTSGSGKIMPRSGNGGT